MWGKHQGASGEGRIAWSGEIRGKLVIPKDNPELPSFLAYVDVEATFKATFDVDALTGEEGAGEVDAKDGFTFYFAAKIAFATEPDHSTGEPIFAMTGNFEVTYPFTAPIVLTASAVRR